MSWRDTYRVHPACDVFPMMTDAELEALGKDIKARGVLSPILVAYKPVEGGRVGSSEHWLCDGRNRLEAMDRLGLTWDSGTKSIDDRGLPICLETETIAYVETVIVSRIISLNIHRRHLTKQQQAELIVAAHKASRQVDEVPNRRHVKGKAGSERDDLKAAIVADADKQGISKSTVERAMRPKPTEEEIAARTAADEKRSATLAATKERKLAEAQAKKELDSLRERNDIAELMGLLTPHLTRDEINRVLALAGSLSWRWSYEGFTYEGQQYCDASLDDVEDEASVEHHLQT